MKARANANPDALLGASHVPVALMVMDNLGFSTPPKALGANHA